MQDTVGTGVWKASVCCDDLPLRLGFCDRCCRQTGIASDCFKRMGTLAERLITFSSPGIQWPLVISWCLGKVPRVENCIILRLMKQLANPFSGWFQDATCKKLLWPSGWSDFQNFWIKSQSVMTVRYGAWWFVQFCSGNRDKCGSFVNLIPFLMINESLTLRFVQVGDLH